MVFLINIIKANVPGRILALGEEKREQIMTNAPRERVEATKKRCSKAGALNTPRERCLSSTVRDILNKMQQSAVHESLQKT